MFAMSLSDSGFVDLYCEERHIKARVLCIICTHPSEILDSDVATHVARGSDLIYRDSP